MTLSVKQIAFAKYLLTKFGFTSDEKMHIYLNKLEGVVGRAEWNSYLIGTSQYGYPYYHKELRWNNSYVIECLLKEKEIKENLHLLKGKEGKSYITASDLSNYIYCPVSYIIQNSFLIEFPTNKESTNIGTEFHEDCRLSRITSNRPIEDSQNFNPDILTSKVLTAIRKSEVLFEGHSENDRYFNNEKHNYIGQPDYILNSENNNVYVVEEKFNYHPIEKYHDDEEMEIRAKKALKYKKGNFFDNHLIQLQSYIDLICDYKIKFGILINWYYEINKYTDTKYVYDFSYKILYPSNDKSSTLFVINSINNILKGKVVSFEDVNLKKCGACSVNKYCVHKNNNVREISYPYRISEMRLKYAPFPELLNNKTSQNEEE